MIEAKHTRWGTAFFRLFSSLGLRRTFARIVYVEKPTLTDASVLMIGNHFSWWDGFIQWQVNRRFFNKRFYVMMLESQLSKNPILKYGGAFSIQKNSRAMLDSLRYAHDLLQDKQNLVLMFPQGALESQHEHHPRFEKGLEVVLRNLDDSVQVIFNLNLTDFFAEKKPSLYVYMETYVGLRTHVEMEAAYRAFVKRCLERQKIRL